jgi:chromosome segregation ATPase
VLAALDNRGQDVSNRIVIAGDHAAQSLDRAVAVLGERGQEVSGHIAESGDRAIQAIDQQMAGLAAVLTRRTDDLIAAVNGAAADPVRALGALASQVRAEVLTSSEALRGVAEEAAQRAAETIESLFRRNTQEVPATGPALRQNLSQIAPRSVGVLAGAGDRLRNELTQVIDNLGQTSAAIDETVAAAADRLSNVQSGLAGRVEEFQRALGGIASQVTILGRLSTTTQADASALARELGEQTEALSLAAEELAAQQSTIDLALEQRQNSLKGLLGDLTERSATFDAVLGRYASNVEDSFGRAQARAQEIGATLAAATRGASVAVAGQFESIRDSAAKEREKTAQSLQAAIDQTNAHLSAALDKAAERFRQSVAEVKEMASQVQRELETTRQELRRGVLELPQETSETAEAMRRVVSDQIRALKELAALVSDSGADFDVAEPGQQAVAVAVGSSGSAGAARYPQPVNRAVEAPRRVESASAREAAVARAPEPIASPGVQEVLPPQPGAAPERPAGRANGSSWPASPSAEPGPAADRSQSGWLSSLLAAASREEPEAAPHAPETLEDLTQSIAGLVDSAAAAETWDRWRRGDAAVVSRRLYTEAGQQAFDEIRRRYRSDPQFRETVTRYVQEFERLLAKVGQNDRDGSQWRAYLMSNTGKVYTILAHASGRLG